MSLKRDPIKKIPWRAEIIPQMVLSHQKFHWDICFFMLCHGQGAPGEDPVAVNRSTSRKSVPHHTLRQVETQSQPHDPLIAFLCEELKVTARSTHSEVAKKPLSTILLTPESSYGATRVNFQLVSLGAQIVGVKGAHNIRRCPQNFKGIIIIVMIVVVVCVCVVTRACGARVENKEQLWRVSSSVFLLSCGSQGTNSGLQAYRARAFTWQVIFLSLNFLFLERVKILWVHLKFHPGTWKTVEGTDMTGSRDWGR